MTSRYVGQFTFSFMRDVLGFLTEMARSADDVACVKIARQHLVLVNDPAGVQEVLVARNEDYFRTRGASRFYRVIGGGLLTSEGPWHRRQRTLVRKGFRRDAPAFGEAVVRNVERLTAGWQPGQVIDVWSSMARVTMNAASESFFDLSLGDDVQKVSDAYVEIFARTPLVQFPGAGVLDHLPLPNAFRVRRAIRYLDAIAERLMSAYCPAAHGTTDVLDAFAAPAPADEALVCPRRQLRAHDEMLTLLGAGHETTASTLAWLWYTLPSVPEIEQRIQAELDAAFAESAPTPESASELPYVRAVLAEVLRLFPPLWLLGRHAVRPTTISGYDIPVGSIVLACPYLMHRDARFFDDPLTFRPERWLDQTSQRPNPAYIPFGGGGRRCLGERFAWLEGALTVAMIARHWRLRRVDGPEPGLYVGTALRPDRPIHMRLERRAHD